jgi:hypothetical protein
MKMNNYEKVVNASYENLTRQLKVATEILDDIPDDEHWNSLLCRFIGNMIEAELEKRRDAYNKNDLSYRDTYLYMVIMALARKYCLKNKNSTENAHKFYVLLYENLNSVIFKYLDLTIIAKAGGESVIERMISIACLEYMPIFFIAHNKIRTYIATQNLNIALAHTKLKGLNIDDLHLPEQFTAVYIEKPVRSMVFFLDMTPYYESPTVIELLFIPGYFYMVNLAVTPDSIEELYIGGSSDDAKEIHRIAINTLLYVTNNPNDVTTAEANKNRESLTNRMLKAIGSKKEKLKQRLKNCPSIPVNMVGKYYTIDKNIQRALEQAEATGKHLSTRFIVAGHWRNQACGLNRLERKLLWIEPYWKGPEFAPITRSIGVVK